MANLFSFGPTAIKVSYSFLGSVYFISKASRVSIIIVMIFMSWLIVYTYYDFQQVCKYLLASKSIYRHSQIIGKHCYTRRIDDMESRWNRLGCSGCQAMCLAPMRSYSFLQQPSSTSQVSIYLFSSPLPSSVYIYHSPCCHCVTGQLAWRASTPYVPLNIFSLL